MRPLANTALVQGIFWSVLSSKISGGFSDQNDRQCSKKFFFLPGNYVNTCSTGMEEMVIGVQRLSFLRSLCEEKNGPNLTFYLKTKDHEFIKYGKRATSIEC